MGAGLAVVFPRRSAQHRGVTEAELARLPVQDAAEARPRVPSGRLTLRILPVTITHFSYGWSFWLFITWLPSFFKDHYNLDLKNAALFSSAVFFAAVFFAGVIGDTSVGMLCRLHSCSWAVRWPSRCTRSVASLR
jgi:hypothetical protein